MLHNWPLAHRQLFIVALIDRTVSNPENKTAYTIVASVNIQLICIKPRLHEHQVPTNLDHNLHGRGGLSLDLNPVCLQDLDQNARVNGALHYHNYVRSSLFSRTKTFAFRAC